METERWKQTSTLVLQEDGIHTSRTVFENVFQIKTVKVTLEDEKASEKNQVKDEPPPNEETTYEKMTEDSLEQNDKFSLDSLSNDNSKSTVEEKVTQLIDDRVQRRQGFETDNGDDSKKIETSGLDNSTYEIPATEKVDFYLSTDIKVNHTNQTNDIRMVTQLKIFSKDATKPENLKQTKNYDDKTRDDELSEQELDFRENLADGLDAKAARNLSFNKPEVRESRKTRFEKKFEKKESDIETLINEPTTSIESEVSKKKHHIYSLSEIKAIPISKASACSYGRKILQSESQGSTARSSSPATPSKGRMIKDGMTATASQENKQAPRKPATSNGRAGSRATSTSPKKVASVKDGHDPSARTPSSEQKKIPPIKAPVGKAPNPNVKEVKSKIGSMENIKHKPKGGEKKVVTQKLEWNTSSKIGSLENASHRAGGGEKKIISQKLNFKDKAQSKIGSMENASHKPGGGHIKIEDNKLDFKDKAQSRVGSMDNVKHKPGGGEIKIRNEKLSFKEKAQSKIGSMPSSEKGSAHGSETQSTGNISPPPEMPLGDENGEVGL